MFLEAQCALFLVEINKSSFSFFIYQLRANILFKILSIYVIFLLNYVIKLSYS